MKRGCSKGCSRGCFTLLGIFIIISIFGIYAGPDIYDRYMLMMYPKPHQEIVAANAEKFGLDENLIYSVMKAESKFDEKAVSRADAKGLMQVTDETFDWILEKYPDGKESHDIFDPQDNIYAACGLLRILIDKYGFIDVALSAYNAGMGNVSKWLENGDYSSDGAKLHTIPFPETKAYVEKVQKYYLKYQDIYS